MKDDKKFVVGQQSVPAKQLDAAFSGSEMLMFLAKKARTLMYEQMDQEGLVVDPEGFGIQVRVVVECIAVPK